ncbi:right-handed parallel beta-helix repeat-containing protein [Mucilaginibacter rubeus]|uniref:right-handed parallel beta-helix repeat-containing protein n=1 Tax=Mucilaginibacter rubeus TaxID=2027860 RepID=UPI0016810FAC|nr:right-handed parallel beta-helix repeat-containing protein [Mucilaginibacter rubeus]
MNKPFATIYKAQQYIRAAIAQGQKGSYQVIFRGGTYNLTKPLTFDDRNDIDSSSSIEFTAFSNENVVLSGGRTLTGSWAKTADPHIWKLNLPAAFNDNSSFQSLFKNGKRLKRAASDTLFTQGPAPEFANSYKVFDFKALSRLVKDSLNVFCAFSYSGTDLDNLKDIAAADVIIYNSWEASWLRVYKVDKARKVIYFRNPSAYPVGFYQPHMRYVIENSLDYLDKPGEWYFDSANKQILYYAATGEDPNKATFIAPVLDQLVAAKGNAGINRYVSNIKFSNINFSYTKSAWGVNLNQQAYGYKAMLAGFKKNNLQKYPWMDLNVGFSASQMALDCGAAITLEVCKNWSFDNCSFTHLGNYAVGILNYSSNNSITKCSINDVGGGGVMIAYNNLGGKRTDVPDNISPTANKVINCTITNCGLVFPSGVGIAVVQANHSLISKNLISNLPYCGISVGWTFSATDDNYTSYNIIQYNNIHDVLQALTDGGGIYTLGKQVGAVYKGNYIYNIYRNKNATGAHCNGFFFDEGSSSLKLDSNVVFNVKDEAMRFNKTDVSKISRGFNSLERVNSSSTLKSEIYKKIIK